MAYAFEQGDLRPGEPLIIEGHRYNGYDTEHPMSGHKYNMTAREAFNWWITERHKYKGPSGTYVCRLTDTTVRSGEKMEEQEFDWKRPTDAEFLAQKEEAQRRSIQEMLEGREQQLQTLRREMQQQIDELIAKVKNCTCGAMK